ncbi:hypothetical protein BS78_04G052500 [Paspalum vaginatum]|nr:hypothetical protein BS78_04G052500 [Paspalum vaginatum]
MDLYDDIDLFSERSKSTSNPIADSPTMANSSGSRGVTTSTSTHRPPNVDNGMTFSQLLRSGSPIATEDADDAVLCGGVFHGGVAGHVPGRGCAGGVGRRRGVGHAAAQSCMTAHDTPAGAMAPKPYRPPRLSGGSGRGGGGCRTARGGGLAASSGNIEVADVDHVNVGDENSRHGEWKKLKNGPPECLEDLEVMFQHVAVNGSSSCVPGEVIKEEHIDDLGDDTFNGSPISQCATSPRKRAGAKIATNPRKRIKSPMVKRMKTNAETMQANSVVTQRVLKGGT